MSYTLLEAEHSGTKRSEITAEGVSEVVEEYVPLMSGIKDPVNTVLVTIGYKDGADLELLTDSIGEAYDFAGTLNEQGVSCAIEEDPETAPHDEDLYDVHIFLTRDLSYNEEDFERMDEGERRWGPFLGYPEKQVEAWENWEEGKRTLQASSQTSVNIDEISRPPVRSAAKAAENQGYDSDPVDMIDRFVSFMVQDTEEGVNTALEIAESYYNALSTVEEAYGFEEGYLTEFGTPEEKGYERELEWLREFEDERVHRVADELEKMVERTDNPDRFMAHLAWEEFGEAAKLSELSEDELRDRFTEYHEIIRSSEEFDSKV